MFFPVIIGRGGGAGGGTAAVAAHASGTGVHPIAAVTGLQAALDVKADAGTNLVVIPIAFGNASQSAVGVAAEFGGVARMWVDFAESARVMSTLTIGGVLGQAGQVIDFQYATAAAPSTWVNFGVGIALNSGSGAAINTAYKSAWVTTPAGAVAESVLSGGCWVRANITAPTGGAGTPSSVVLRNVVLRNETLGHDGADGDPGGTNAPLSAIINTTGTLTDYLFAVGTDVPVRFTTMWARTHAGTCRLALKRGTTVMKDSSDTEFWDIGDSTAPITLAAAENLAAGGKLFATVTAPAGGFTGLSIVFSGVQVA